MNAAEIEALLLELDITQDDQAVVTIRKDTAGAQRTAFVLVDRVAGKWTAIIRDQAGPRTTIIDGALPAA